MFLNKDFAIEKHFSFILAELSKKLKVSRTQISDAPETDKINQASQAIKWLVEAGTLTETAEAIVKKVQETCSSP